MPSATPNARCRNSTASSGPSRWSSNGHGFTDLDATRHMYEQFGSRSDTLESRHFIRDPPDDVVPLADLIVELVEAGLLRYDADQR